MNALAIMLLVTWGDEPLARNQTAQQPVPVYTQASGTNVIEYGSGPGAVVSNTSDVYSQRVIGGGFVGEPMLPYDGPEPWMHGHFQRIPAYGGFHSFRPYNYRHVLAQSQAAGGAGLTPTMPYSQQFWHRYEERARMLDRFPEGAGAVGNREVQRPLRRAQYAPVLPRLP